MMKAGLRDRMAQMMAMIVSSAFECDNQIERSTRYLTNSGRDHSRTIFTVRHTDTTFVWMRGEVFNRSRSISQQFMHRLEGRDLLIVAVCARMIVGPGNRLIVAIVASLP